MFYFNETGDFIVTARYSLETGMLNSYSNETKACEKPKIFPKQSDNGDDYSIIFRPYIKCGKKYTSSMMSGM